MNKKVNLILNITEMIGVLLGVGCIALTFLLRNSLSFPTYRVGFETIGMISLVFVVSIELILFYLENKKYKFFSFLFYSFSFLFSIWMNSTILYSGLGIFMILCIIKNICRILFLDVIYRPLGYYELCRKFGIKVKRPVIRKKKVVSKKNSFVFPFLSKKNIKKKSRKRVEQKTSKSYA